MPASIAAGAGEPASHPRGTLLLVDDEPAVRRGLALALARHGFEVQVAAGLAEAAAAAEAQAPDFAVIDLKLEDGNGLHLVEMLLELRPCCRIVVLTGFDSIASSIRALRAGALHYLAKPVDAARLVGALAGEGGEEALPAALPMSADRVRWEHIQRVFEQCDHDVGETARRLAMHRRTLQRILSKRAPR